MPVYARSFDRRSTIELIRTGVDYELRETFESAIAFGQNALERLGFSEEEAVETMEEVRRRDRERLDLQIAGTIYDGNTLLKGNAPVPTPLQQPRQAGRAINEETAAAMQDRSSA